MGAGHHFISSSLHLVMINIEKKVFCIQLRRRRRRQTTEGQRGFWDLAKPLHLFAVFCCCSLSSLPCFLAPCAPAMRGKKSQIDWTDIKALINCSFRRRSKSRLNGSRAFALCLKYDNEQVSFVPRRRKIPINMFRTCGFVSARETWRQMFVSIFERSAE